MKYDIDTVERAVNGDARAFEELIGIEKERLYYKALSYVGNKEDASDAVQEALYKAFLSISQLQHPPYFSTWLFKILIRECYRLLKKRNRFIPLEDDEIITRLEQTPEEKKDDHVGEALSKLPPPQRSAIVLFYYYGFSVKEIAEMMKKPYGTVKTYLHRGRKALKAQLAAVMHKTIKTTEVIHLIKEELEKIALSITEIPQDFRKIIENHEENEAYFFWMDKEEENGAIAVKLDAEGRLTYLTIDVQQKEENTESSLTVEKKKEIADSFLLHHYPDALQHFTHHRVKEHEHFRCTRFYYEQLVMDIPLNHAGSYIDVNDAGKVILFNYQGLKEVPHIPGKLISPEKLTSHILDQLHFELVVDKFFKGIHDVEEDSLRLVYLPKPSSLKYKATEIEPTSTAEHEEEAPEITRPLPFLAPVEKQECNKEELIGITETMELVREIDCGDEVGIVWRESGWERDEDDLSFEAFFKERTEQTVKAFVSKETSKIRSFLWFHERNGSLQLGREACFETALDFLQLVIPEFLPHLQYIASTNEEGERNETRDFFSFQLQDEHGTPIQSESITVAVNRSTGQIDQYSGPRIDIDQLKALPKEPAISPEQALEIFKEHLDLELVWDKDYREDEEAYELAYKVCDRSTKTAIRAIDAITGEVICDKG